MKKINLLCIMLFGFGCMTTFAQSFKVTKTDGTTYEFKTSETSSIEFIEGKNETKPETGSHEAVDLGLSVKWAKCNVGANTPIEYGDYFAWGETTPKTRYDKSTYKYYSSAIWIDPDGLPINDPGYTKYVKQENAISYGYHDTFDNKTQLDKEDDAAYMNWGGKWRMPTGKEFQELINNCTWSYVTISDVNAYKVTGPSGNYIYLPLADWQYYSFETPEKMCRSGYYWSSTLNSKDSYKVDAIRIEEYTLYLVNYERIIGCSVRPVTE